jgi:hypothetical protein
VFFMREIQLTQGKVALVSDKDYKYLIQWKWHARRSKHDKTYYASRGTCMKGKKGVLSMHRVVMNAQKGQMVDHIDRNGLNNQRENLRFCTHGQNRVNAFTSTPKTSKYVGVHLSTQGKKGKSYIYTCWVASITKDNKFQRIGNYKTEDEAALAYNIKAIEYFGEFANVNKVPEGTVINKKTVHSWINHVCIKCGTVRSNNMRLYTHLDGTTSDKALNCPETLKPTKN